MTEITESCRRWEGGMEAYREWALEGEPKEVGETEQALR